MSNPVLSPVTGCDLPAFLTDKPDVERLYDNVQAVIPGLTTDMTSLVIWNTIEDFYQRSTIRREHLFWEMEPFQLVIDFDPYDQFWRVCRIIAFDGLINPKFELPGRVRDLSHPPPEAERRGEIIVALKPSSLRTELPYDIWTQWFDTLYNGCCYRLYMQPGKPYTDIGAAKLFAAMYRAGVASARALAQAHNVTGGSQWNYPYFSRGRQLVQGWGWYGRQQG